MAGSYDNHVSYNLGDPASGDLMKTGIPSAYNAFILRVQGQTDGAFRNQEDVEKVSNDVSDPSLVVYPNPTSGLVTIELKNPLTDGSLYQAQLFNGIGQELARFPLEASITPLDLSDYPSGVYHFILSNEQGANTYKIVKQ